ncbi:hypothetical protein A2415_00640 [candidate division WWE3 bacterium RIFOXYC1_FULL_39_7]|uniref:Glycosyltransferase RgtA/B/C/D-like domain-containing protein n=2 Tax=Katanobacteria TaxID=422282 RepID=A0A1F4X6P7_UNCKA|nr:MAG: hypothetical protein A2415_00640 [candidate division WWE3 bacterium RIFOXYC1_FULL_39_7]OGC77347.1 MAG: hypothetical protein A2619_04915 [candidate division WWE3 bacterium RIFOXYD1_FULL_39_9]
MSNKNSQNIVLIIFFIALALRLAGITHGFPFIFHPDEPALIRSAYGIKFYLNPGHFDWPHLYIYLNYFLYSAFAFLREILTNLGVKNTLIQILPILWDQELVFYLISRVLSALIGALTVFPVFTTGKRLFNDKVGAFAALALAILPFHVWHSHYALIDVPTAFLVALSCYFASGILKGQNVQDYIGSGLYSGLAASTKYNGGLSLITVPLAHLIRVISNKERWLQSKAFVYLMLALIFSMIGFVLGTPYSVLDYKTFIRTDGPQGALWQFSNVGSLPVSERIPSFINDMLYKVSENTGYTVLLGFFLVFAVLLVKLLMRKTTKTDTYLWFFTLSGLFLMFYISGFEKSRAHYFMIAYPYVVITFGYLVDTLYVYLDSKIKYISIVMMAILFGLPFYMSAKNALTFINSDTRVDMYNWFTQNVKEGDSIVYNNNELKPVMEKLLADTSKSDDISVDKKPSYVVLSYNDDVYRETFAFLKHSGNLKPLVTIDNEFRLGPDITIYKYQE